MPPKRNATKQPAFLPTSDTSMLTPLNTGEIRIPASLQMPTMKGNRWASEVMTNTQTFGMFPAVLPDEAPPSADNLLFPPPPPPMRSLRHTEPEFMARMMRWFQIVEAWCTEPGIPDNQRAVVAPPPRPPPFMIGDTPLARALPVPYTFKIWEDRSRRWWAYVARIFDKLRMDPLWEVGHVSKGTATNPDRSFIVQQCVGEDAAAADGVSE